jgi:hypothetical protein
VAKTQQLALVGRAKFILFAKLTENTRIFKTVGANEFLQLALF